MAKRKKKPKSRSKARSTPGTAVPRTRGGQARPDAEALPQIGLAMRQIDCFTIARVMNDGTLIRRSVGRGPLSNRASRILDIGYSAVAVSSVDETILAVGASSSVTTSTTELVRYRANGSIDASFGASGFAQALPLVGWRHQAAELAVQADGRIVVVGNYGDLSMVDMLVARYCP